MLKMKKQITILIGILLIGIATAGVIALVLTPSSFTPEPARQNIRYEGNITFDCGKEHKSVYLNEPNLDIDEDFEEAVKGMCSQPITNILDWNGREYKQDKNYPECRSFNETKIERCAANTGVTPNP